MPVSDAILTQILAQLDAMQVSQQTMQAKVRIHRHRRLCSVQADPNRNHDVVGRHHRQ